MCRLKPLKQLAARVPRLGLEPSVQLLCHLHQRIGPPPAALRLRHRYGRGPCLAFPPRDAQSGKELLQRRYSRVRRRGDRLSEVRDAALILLYRLLFILYAEDRDLLPVRDERYDDYALRDRVRGDVGRRKDRGDVFSETAARYWSAVDDLCRAVDQGDVSIGLPPYNGGLFDPTRTPLLDGLRLGDRVMADVIDALSFEQGEAGRRYINYRDLGVRQLGSIYERLLEHEIVLDGDEVAVRPNIFARKGSGSYYTPDDLVGLIVEETVGPLVKARLDRFLAEAGRVPEAGPARERAVARLKEHDPAERLLELKVCDPAMGSGHFLVNLVDYLADRVIAAMAEAEAEVDGYVSPLADRIQAIRERIAANAAERDWAIDLDRLDDRHVVRRMVLKRCVYGVDKNPMAVELAKVTLWLHTFTVNAPAARTRRQRGRAGAGAADLRGHRAATAAASGRERRPDLRRARPRRGTLGRIPVRAGHGRGVHASAHSRCLSQPARRQAHPGRAGSTRRQRPAPPAQIRIRVKPRGRRRRRYATMTGEANGALTSDRSGKALISRHGG